MIFCSCWCYSCVCLKLSQNTNSDYIEERLCVTKPHLNSFRGFLVLRVPVTPLFPLFYMASHMGWFWNIDLVKILTAVGNSTMLCGMPDFFSSFSTFHVDVLNPLEVFLEWVYYIFPTSTKITPKSHNQQPSNIRLTR